jgi:molybdenum cofactor guanylyltransferase
MRVLGAVLAGGRSRRFGSDKAAALLGGRPLLDHVVDALRPQVDAVVVCGRRHPSLPSLVDRPGPDLGPLGGLSAALHHAEAHGFELVLTAGCDMPGFGSDVLDTLQGHSPAVLAGQQIVGLWPSALAQRLDDYLASASDFSIRAWVREGGARELPFGRMIANVNSPADLERLASGA